MTRTLALLLCLAPVGAFAQQTPVAPPADPHVVVSGEGLVLAVPDRAWITISAESRASSPREAQKRNTDAMTPVLGKLKAAGVPADAIRTIAYDVQYEWEFVNNRRVGKGYLARNTIDVRVDNVERVGEYLEIAAGSGATSLGGIRFDLKDRAKLERAGRNIDRIIRIEEATGFRPVPVDRVMVMREAAQAGDASSAPPISAGQTEIRAHVTITAVLK